MPGQGAVRAAWDQLFGTREIRNVSIRTYSSRRTEAAFRWLLPWLPTTDSRPAFGESTSYCSPAGSWWSSLPTWRA